MTDITIINKEVKKMKDSKKPGEPVASSRDVAKRFGKRHDHVIRDIAEIVKSFPKNEDTPLFFKTEYVHPQNHQKYPMYLMNRDGFRCWRWALPARRPPSERPQQALGRTALGKTSAGAAGTHPHKEGG